MSFLLDTHVLLWWLDGSTKLGRKARTLLAQPDAPVFSVASPFEIAVKVSTGKLRIDLAQALPILRSADFRPLQLATAHYVALSNLPLLHRDPFDRLIVAQALVEGLTIMTEDADIRRYPVRTIGCD